MSRFYGFSDAPHSVYAVVANLLQKREVIYVGETGKPQRRFEQHLKAAYGGAEIRKKIDRREREIILKSGTLEFHCLEPCSDRVSALAQEASWARSLRTEGCDLSNNWPEHLPSSKVGKVPMNRLLDMSLKEAREIKASLQLKCARCGLELNVSTEALAKLKIRNPTLKKFDGVLRCEGCNQPYEFSVGLSEATERSRVINALSADGKGFLRSIQV